VLSLGSVSAAAGGTALLPVSINDAAGVESLQLRLRFDPAALALESVLPTALGTGFQLSITELAPGDVVVQAQRVQPLASGSGELFTLRLGVAAMAAPGSLAVDLVAVQVNGRGLAAAQSTALLGPDAGDGRIDVLAAPTLAFTSRSTGGSERKSGTPLLALDSFSSGFAIGDAGSTWLDDWVSQSTAKRANNWTLVAKAP
jgi:hypothetical protein